MRLKRLERRLRGKANEQLMHAEAIRVARLFACPLNRLAQNNWRTTRLRSGQNGREFCKVGLKIYDRDEQDSCS
jgi:hypothetical protein